MTVLVGIAFIVAVSQVYYGGIKENPDYPFEIARIKEHILLPFIFLLCWIAAIIGGAVLSVIFPVAEKKTSYTDNSAVLNRLKTKIPASGGEEFSAATKNIAKYEKIRLIIWNVALVVFTAAAISILIYSFNVTHYHADALKKDILELVKNVLSWTGAAMVVGIAAAIVDGILIKREIAEAKTAIKDGDKTEKSDESVKEVSKKAAIWASIAAGVVIGVALIAYAVEPLIIQAVLSSTQTVIYVIVFIVMALFIAGFTVYNIFKAKIPDKTNQILLIVARSAVGVIAVTFIIVGIFNGGANDVLIKAINICTECIGLG